MQEMQSGILQLPRFIHLTRILNPVRQHFNQLSRNQNIHHFNYRKNIRFSNGFITKNLLPESKIFNHGSLLAKDTSLVCACKQFSSVSKAAHFNLPKKKSCTYLVSMKYRRYSSAENSLWNKLKFLLKRKQAGPKNKIPISKMNILTDFSCPGNLKLHHYFADMDYQERISPKKEESAQDCVRHRMLCVKNVKPKKVPKGIEKTEVILHKPINPNEPACMPFYYKEVCVKKEWGKCVKFETKCITHKDVQKRDPCRDCIEESDVNVIDYRRALVEKKEVDAVKTAYLKDTPCETTLTKKFPDYNKCLTHDSEPCDQPPLVTISDIASQVKDKTNEESQSAERRCRRNKKVKTSSLIRCRQNYYKMSNYSRGTVRLASVRNKSDCSNTSDCKDKKSDDTKTQNKKCVKFSFSCPKKKCNLEDAPVPRKRKSEKNVPREAKCLKDVPVPRKHKCEKIVPREVKCLEDVPVPRKSRKVTSEPILVCKPKKIESYVLQDVPVPRRMPKKTQSCNMESLSIRQKKCLSLKDVPVPRKGYKPQPVILDDVMIPRKAKQTFCKRQQKIKFPKFNARQLCGEFRKSHRKNKPDDDNMKVKDCDVKSSNFRELRSQTKCKPDNNNKKIGVHDVKSANFNFHELRKRMSRLKCEPQHPVCSANFNSRQLCAEFQNSQKKSRPLKDDDNTEIRICDIKPPSCNFRELRKKMSDSTCEPQQPVCPANFNSRQLYEEFQNSQKKSRPVKDDDNTEIRICDITPSNLNFRELRKKMSESTCEPQEPVCPANFNSRQLCEEFRNTQNKSKSDDKKGVRICDMPYSRKIHTGQIAMDKTRGRNTSKCKGDAENDPFKSFRDTPFVINSPPISKKFGGRQKTGCVEQPCTHPTCLVTACELAKIRKEKRERMEKMSKSGKDRKSQGPCKVADQSCRASNTLETKDQRTCSSKNSEPKISCYCKKEPKKPTEEHNCSICRKFAVCENKTELINKQVKCKAKKCRKKSRAKPKASYGSAPFCEKDKSKKEKSHRKGPCGNTTCAQKGCKQEKEKILAEPCKREPIPPKAPPPVKDKCESIVKIPENSKACPPKVNINVKKAEGIAPPLKPKTAQKGSKLESYKPGANKLTEKGKQRAILGKAKSKANLEKLNKSVASLEKNAKNVAGGISDIFKSICSVSSNCKTAVTGVGKKVKEAVKNKRAVAVKLFEAKANACNTSKGGKKVETRSCTKIETQAGANKKTGRQAKISAKPEPQIKATKMTNSSVKLETKSESTSRTKVGTQGGVQKGTGSCSNLTKKTETKTGTKPGTQPGLKKERGSLIKLALENCKKIKIQVGLKERSKSCIKTETKKESQSCSHVSAPATTKKETGSCTSLGTKISSKVEPQPGVTQRSKKEKEQKKKTEQGPQKEANACQKPTTKTETKKNSNKKTNPKSNPGPKKGPKVASKTNAKREKWSFLTKKKYYFR